MAIAYAIGTIAGNSQTTGKPARPCDKSKAESVRTRAWAQTRVIRGIKPTPEQLDHLTWSHRFEVSDGMVIPLTIGMTC